MSDSPQLFDSFPPMPPKLWKQKIQYELGGADYNEELTWKSPEGIVVKPFYTAEDVNKEFIRPSLPKKWFAGQEFYVGDQQKIKPWLDKALVAGIESPMLTIPTPETAVGELLPLLKTQKNPVLFKMQFLSASYNKRLLEQLPKDYKVHCNLDIVGHLAASGNWYLGEKEDHGQMLESLHHAQSHPSSSVLGVDVSLYQNSGANMVQQLAYALSHANEYVNHLYNLKQLGLWRPITFKVSLGSNYFFEIAKLRALRMLWQSLAKEYGLDETCYIQAQPTLRNKLLYDFNTNLLRTTSESMAAIIGGADMVVNLPYDVHYKKTHAFSRRLAKNQLLILREEAHLDDVSKASEGTYYIQSITEQLAHRSLDLFKDLEKGGGFLKQLKTGAIQKKITESAQKEQQTFDSGKAVIVGGNCFEEKDNRMKDAIELYPFVKYKPRKTKVQPIIPKRLVESREQKRLGNE